ncbi:hypothetical protein [Mycolicibacterium goodii]|uniref:hypothetical protein n=1 Tax=Mycolicibacterium goodii TaxID=134601 RepID=UPI001BDC0C5E|nr:hypothetical protein [Mycolicibacterium goodii]MBU8829767.1 hypothetical protein [Mycolicibacterium goodii]
MPFDLVLQVGVVVVVLSFLVATMRRALAVAVWHVPEKWNAFLRAHWWRNVLQLSVFALATYIVGDALLGPVESNPAAHALFVWLWVGWYRRASCSDRCGGCSIRCARFTPPCAGCFGCP